MSENVTFGYVQKRLPVGGQIHLLCYKDNSVRFSADPPGSQVNGCLVIMQNCSSRHTQTQYRSVPYITVHGGIILSKIAYANRTLHKSSRQLLDKMVKIVEEYEDMGYRITVRQLYYQLVSRDILPNSMSSYQKTSKLLTIGRMTGQIDWDTIVDKARNPLMPSEFETMQEFVEAVRDSYRKCRWDGQDSYVEVLVEKEALVGILEPVTRKYHVLLLANKGYLSASAMHDTAQRAIYHQRQGRECKILYFGDHDPSGMDMVRDIEDRLYRFDAIADVERIALTMDQIKKYDPPPNPAKMTDPRSGTYMTEYGTSSWELDALNPDVLVRLVESAIVQYMDRDLYDDMVSEEEEEKARLDRAVCNME